MPIVNENGASFWIPSMSRKGRVAFDSTKRCILLHGPRKTTKSNAAQNKLIRHLWDNNRATAAIIVKGLKGAIGSGVWEDIIKPDGILESDDTEYSKIGWFKSGIGAKYTVPPTMKSDTKMRFFRMTNRHGTDSECQIHTLQNDDDVETIFKDTKFSFIYMVEADRFESESVFRYLIMQLRLPNVPHANRQIILDCNPPRIGEKHWIYRTFIRRPDGAYIPDLKPDFFELGFKVEDNPFISEAEKQEIYDSNAQDPIDLARNYYGEWVKSSKGGLFRHQFRPSFHVVGDLTSSDPANHTLLVPSPDSIDRPMGWDLGDAMNHAMVMMAKRPHNNRFVFDVYDELVITNQNFATREFGRIVLDKMDYWEALTRSQDKDAVITWRSWADASNSRYLSAADASMAMVIADVSGGRIHLIGVQKGDGSIAKRINLLKRVLFQNLLFISPKCKNVIEMLSFMESSDPTGNALTLDPTNPHKHIFDALTYALMNELPSALIDGPSTVGVDEMVHIR